jgi:hypothetical protein
VEDLLLNWFKSVPLIIHSKKTLFKGLYLSLRKGVFLLEKMRTLKIWTLVYSLRNPRRSR